MINIMIEVPSLGRKYQFNVDETVPADTVIAEMVEVICRKEQSSFHTDNGRLCLCEPKSARILSEKTTLREAGIRNSDLLILI